MAVIDRPATKRAFELVPGNSKSEVADTLDGAVPQSLGFFDQIGLWGNLGVSLLGFTGALFVLQPGGDGTPALSLIAGIIAIVVGSILGTLAIAMSGFPGARTGAPAMVLLRGLFGARASYVPTALNITQCLGWAVFELVTIATAAHVVWSDMPRWAYIAVAGVITTGLAVFPLGAIRVLRKYVTALVAVMLAYLFVQILRHPLPSLTTGSWSGFWVAMDTTVAAAVSFVPLASDYTRHARTPRTAFVGTLVGYGVTQILCYLLGLLTLLTVARDSGDIYGAFIAVPVGSVAFAILAGRELDQSFANVYSTSISIQNIGPRISRKLLSLTVGMLATVLALSVTISDYENFLLLLGSVFVPMSGVLAADYFLVSRGNWDLKASAPFRATTCVSWLVGAVVYQLINPGYLAHWSTGWSSIRDDLGFTPPSWMSASISSFVVAGAFALALGLLAKRSHVFLHRFAELDVR